MPIHANSRTSHRQLDKAARRDLVLSQVPSAIGVTDRAVAEALGFTDMNAVRPTITHLLREGVLVEDGTTRCPSTRRTVRLVRRRSPGEARTDPNGRRILIGNKSAALLTTLCRQRNENPRRTVYAALLLLSRQP